MKEVPMLSLKDSLVAIASSAVVRLSVSSVPKLVELT